MIPLIVLPSTLILFGLVVSFLVLGEAVPDTVAQPAALAYGIPGLLSGLGMSIIYRRGIRAAVSSKQEFGRVLPLAVMPETSAIFGLVVSFLLIGGGPLRTGVMLFGTEAVWLASALAMVGGIGGLLGAWLAASGWDFVTTETWPKVLATSARGGYVTAVCFALAMVFLQEWLALLFVLIWFGGALALGLVLFVRARHKRIRSTRPS